MKKGIYCLETGEWYGSAKQRDSVEPILQLLNNSVKVPYVHRDIATREELFYYLRHWTQRRFNDHPILYLAFHGRPGSVITRRASGREDLVAVDEVISALSEKCSKRFIHFGGCSSIRSHGHTLNRYLRETGAMAITGFDEDVDWLDSTMFELALFASLQDVSLRRDSLRRMFRKLRSRYRPICRELGFRLALKK